MVLNKKTHPEGCVFSDREVGLRSGREDRHAEKDDSHRGEGPCRLHKRDDRAQQSDCGQNYNNAHGCGGTTGGV